MKLLTEFDFKDKMSDAIFVHSELFKLVQMNKYIAYADIYRLINNNDEVLPSFYEHWGWTNLSGCRVESKNGYEIKLILPPIKNIEKVIKFSKGE